MFANVIDELEVFLLGPSSSVCVLLIAAGFPHCIVISAFEEIKLGMEKLVVLYNISERERESIGPIPTARRDRIGLRVEEEMEGI